MFYTIPENLASEIDALETVIAEHLRGEADAATLKVRRVPFGCYEQRRPGTYMLRVRATGGAITPAQLRGLAQVAAQYGASTLHITTRQEFQIHDVAMQNVIPALRALLPLGLSTRGGGGNTVRNIIVSPEAGIGSDEVFDPSPWAFALTSRLIAEEDSWNLPRKYKIAFSNSPADSAYAQFNDLGFIATIQNGVQGFKVYVAGGLGIKATVGHLLHEFIPAEDAYRVAAALKHFFDKHGNRKNRNAARLRFLWSQLGERRFRALYQAEFERMAQSPEAKLAPLALDHPQGADAEPAPIAQNDRQDFARWRKRYVVAQRQPGLFSIIVPIALGNIENHRAVALADFLAPFGPHSIRAAFGQNLRLRNIPGTALSAAYEAVREITQLADAPLAIGNAISCTGADTCQLGICLPKAALTAIEEQLHASTLNLDNIPSFQINLSGCPNSCGQHSFADLGFYGQARHSKGREIYPAYGVVAGGMHADGQARLAQTIGTVAAHDLPEFTREVLALWLEKSYRFHSFAEYIDAEGKAEIQSICERFGDVPEFSTNPEYYSDWGAKQPFSLVGRGQGECSAGLFDQIGIDLKRIADLRKRLALPLSTEERAKLLYQIALSASRALLVTRGIQANDDESVFTGFQRHFIGAGLIDSRFYVVVDRVRLREDGGSDRREADILALADAVNTLYENLDNSLRIPA